MAGVSLGGELLGTDGYRLPLLASLPDQHIALTLYRERREVEDATMWATGLRSASIARLLGWRIYRVPVAWLGTDRQGEILALLR